MITAIVLAAGESKRMGEPKMLMPWGRSTVLQTVIHTLQGAGLDDILVVTGGSHEQVESLVGKSAQVVYNEDFARSEMLGSVQLGLMEKMREAGAALICLGDQPQIQVRTVQNVCGEFRHRASGLVVPSYNRRRGHPWLVARPLWDAILRLKPPKTLRDFLSAHRDQITYLEVDTSSVVEDLDTPADYLKYKP
jgi:molybdenum cofactor cytidylyltransferase